MLKRLRIFLSPVDFVSITFLSILIVLNLIFADRVREWAVLVFVNIVVIGGIAWLAHTAERKQSKLFIGLHRWYCYPIILFVFKEIYLMVHPIHPTDYDALLMSIDWWVFGVNPTQWFFQFAHPILTEILQLAYFSYYLLFIIMGVEVYRRYPIEEFDHAAFLIVYGFYLSYIGYFALPGIGPRFTVHDFSAMNSELPGLLLTEPIRTFINTAESIRPGISNPQDFVQRDIFPSGHTQLSLITLFLGFRYNLKSRWTLASLASLLIVGTVYLRYHYVVDLFGGVVFFLVSIWTGDKIRNWWIGKNAAKE
jgi:membrane-associated phospholipid phosphatase